MPDRPAVDWLADLIREQPVMTTCPRFDVVLVPDLAHRQLCYGLGPVVLVDELLDPLAADAEQAADLLSADKVLHGKHHSPDTNSHLTNTQGMSKVVT